MEKITKYYCILLANCFDNYSNYICPKKHSCIEDVLEKTYSSLNKSSLIDNFSGLDNKIKVKEQGTTVKGIFPIIAEEKDGLLVDIITQEPIVSAKEEPETPSLSYIEKYPIDEPTVNILLRELDQYGKETYKNGIKRIKYYSKLVSLGLNKEYYYRLVMESTEGNPPFTIYAIEKNGRMIEIITETPIYHYESNEINNSLSYIEETQVSYEEVIKFFNRLSDDDKLSNDYITYINRMQKAKTKLYNDFVTSELSKQSSSKKKIRLKKQSTSQN